MLFKLVVCSSVFLVNSSLVRVGVKPVIKTSILKKKEGKITKKHKHIPKPSGMLLYNLTDQQLIQTKNMNVAIPPASLTKMMTLYAVAKAVKNGKASLNDYVVFSRKAATQKPSKLGVRVGEKMRLKDALKAMMILSANDVAYGIGEHIYGANVEQEFNKLAKELEMLRTYFGNATGLNHKQQITTPKDMLKLIVALRRLHPEYMNYSSSRQFCWKGSCRTGTNKLIGQVQGMLGFKTGFLASSGYHLATYSKLANKEFVGIFMGHGSSRERNQYVKQILQSYHRKLFENKYVKTDNVLNNPTIMNRFTTASVLGFIAQQDSMKKQVSKKAPKKILKQMKKQVLRKKVAVKRKTHKNFITSLL